MRPRASEREPTARRTSKRLKVNVNVKVKVKCNWIHTRHDPADTQAAPLQGRSSSH